MSGIQTEYIDALGKSHAAPATTIRTIEEAMGVGGPSAAHGDAATVVTEPGSRLQVGPAEIELEDGATLRVDGVLPRDVPEGYHRIQRRSGRASTLIVAPRVCHLPASFRTWGWAVQLYGARSRRSWGIGDLGDLRWLGRWAAEANAGIALINPLAAASPTLPQQPSPYFPSSRRFRNPLYLRIEEVEGARGVQGLARLGERGRALNAAREIDRDAIFRLKSSALQKIWQRVRGRRNAAFERFRREQTGLEQFAIFSVLAERFGAGWQGWPAEFRHPGSAAVAAAVRDTRSRDRVLFHQWVQFQIDRQLARASAAMPVMQDLPIGFDAGGADGWAFQDVLAQGISVGAPPDEFNTRGQDWGLPPFVPDKLRSAGYEPFVQTIRACLRHAGGLRIDHAMGLFRLFWIPVGSEPRDGAYVRSHAADLLSIVALESQRARAVIVGEDLGTVEEEAREQLAAKQILSYRLLWFEKTPPAKFPDRALAAVTTHDLPTIAGLWSDSDLEAQKRLGLSPNEAGTVEIKDRVRKLTGAGPQTPVPEIVARVHEGLSRSRSRILTATLDDAMAVEERPNMPATTDEWPNWRLALPKPIESLRRSPLAARIARALARKERRARRRARKQA
jgi:4-alpha-glucanotransferase